MITCYIGEIQVLGVRDQGSGGTLTTNDYALITDYVWGLDLDGTLQGAGGVGGLLAVIKSDCVATNSSLVTRSSSLYLPTYDANGNISEYVTTNGEVVAHYDYSPFGETLVQSGYLADTFTHRFSTKPWCPVTGLYEYQMRKYRPEIGRWLSRDPVLQPNCQLLPYVMLSNNPIDVADYLGPLTRTITREVKIGEMIGSPTPRWSIGHQEYYIEPIMGTYEITFDYESYCNTDGPHIEIDGIKGNLKRHLDESSIGIGIIGFSYKYQLSTGIRSDPDRHNGGMTVKTLYVDWEVFRVHSIGVTIGIGPISFPFPGLSGETSRESLAKGTETFTQECCNE